jgi:cob(I)alamin adenosyltransferase
VVCRRAERSVVRIRDRATLPPVVLPYLNRLSDLLFVMARTAAHRAGRPEITWTPAPPV